MRLNRNELRKIQYDFNSISNRLLQADFNDYVDVLGKFMTFLSSTPIINDYITDCGVTEWNVADEVKELQTSYDREVFSPGETEEEEVRNVYAVLSYIVEKQLSIQYGLAMGYSASNKFQDKIKGFNDRFVMILIRHIERYLTKVGIDMGLDDKVVYNVTVQNGQAIIATDNAMVTATNQSGLDAVELKKLISDVQENSVMLNDEEKEAVADSLEVIENEVMSDKPKKSMMRTALTTLKGIKGVAEFGSAVAALIQFVGPLI